MIWKRRTKTVIRKNLAEDPNCTERSEQEKTTGDFKRPGESLMNGPVNGG